ncbi:MAG: 4-(cytidine 5'-diphospho)-2-C-methyl-D-erythritol kinase [Bacillota bacterium]
MDKLTVVAPAKINLSLDIVKKRKDSYHDLEMIMQSVSLYDRVLIQKKNKEGIFLKCSDRSLPDNENNLAYQAAKLLLVRYKKIKGVEIFIDKNIPVAAGLAGGSTDAAAVLRGINKLYNLGISNKNMKEMASSIGSDVPFCLQGGTVFARGRGTEIKQLSDLKKTFLVLVTPPVEVSTARVYSKYDEIKPDLNVPTDKLIKMINTRNNIDWKAGWKNILEYATIKITSEVERIRRKLEEFHPKLVLMSGSGPSFFAVVENKIEAQKIVSNWPYNQDFITVVYTIKKGYGELQDEEDY